MTECTEEVYPSDIKATIGTAASAPKLESFYMDNIINF